LKDVNNVLYMERIGNVYAVVDLGASLGRTGDGFMRSKGVAKDFKHSLFIAKVHREDVDFVLHSRPFFLAFFFNPGNYRMRSAMEKIVRHIPSDDARWLGLRLSNLFAAQIRDCFTAFGFSPEEVDIYLRTITKRIEALKNL